MKVAVIGAGPAGLCTAHYLKKYIPDAKVEVFEIADDVGGAWRYTENTENDEHGLPPMTVMYKNLRQVIIIDFTYYHFSYLLLNKIF